MKVFFQPNTTATNCTTYCTVSNGRSDDIDFNVEWRDRPDNVIHFVDDNVVTTDARCLSHDTGHTVQKENDGQSHNKRGRKCRGHHHNGISNSKCIKKEKRKLENKQKRDDFV